MLDYDCVGGARAVSARVQLPAALREYAAGAADLEVHATDVDGVLAELARRYPLLRRHLFNDAGALRDFVRVYLNETDVRDLAGGGAAPVRAGDVILIVPSIAGGSGSETPAVRADERDAWRAHRASRSHRSRRPN